MLQFLNGYSQPSSTSLTKQVLWENNKYFLRLEQHLWPSIVIARLMVTKKWILNPKHVIIYREVRWIYRVPASPPPLPFHRVHTWEGRTDVKNWTEIYGLLDMVGHECFNWFMPRLAGPLHPSTNASPAPTLIVFCFFAILVSFNFIMRYWRGICSFGATIYRNFSNGRIVPLLILVSNAIETFPFKCVLEDLEFQKIRVVSGEEYFFLIYVKDYWC